MFRVYSLSFFFLFPSAAFSASGISAAAGKVDVTPDLQKETVWLAGYGATGRKPSGIHSPLHARALVISDGRKTAAFLALDFIGVFREDVEELRRLSGFTTADRYLFVSATHQHAGPDTAGLWGRFPGICGVDHRYRRRWQRAAARLLKELEGRLEPASLYAASSSLDPRGRCRDLRDPVVLDAELNAVQLRAKGGAGTIATIVRWSCHPEVFRADNRLVSADYPGALCAKVEKETGGECLFQAGVIGGLLSPDTARQPHRQAAEVERLGGEVAAAALRSLKGAQALPVSRVEFASKLVRVPVENSRYLLFLPSLVFGHRLYDKEGRELARWWAWEASLRHFLFFPLDEERRPWVETEVARVVLGDVSFVGIPGELFPELAVGGYDGSLSFGQPLIRPHNPNPPDLKRAPRGPYLRQKAGGRHAILVGLANDELGYIVPEYDFQIAGTRSLTPLPAGTHYEETNSIGPRATRILLDAFDELLKR